MLKLFLLKYVLSMIFMVASWRVKFEKKKKTILLGFKYIACSIPMLSFLGVSVGVGNIFGDLILAIARNQEQEELLIRWAFIGFSLVEVSGFIGLVYSFLILFAF